VLISDLRLIMQGILTQVLHSQILVPKDMPAMNTYTVAAAGSVIYQCNAVYN